MAHPDMARITAKLRIEERELEARESHPPSRPQEDEVDWVALDDQEASAEAEPTFGLERRAGVLAVAANTPEREPLIAFT